MSAVRVFWRRFDNHCGTVLKHKNIGRVRNSLRSGRQHLHILTGPIGGIQDVLRPRLASLAQFEIRLNRTSVPVVTCFQPLPDNPIRVAGLGLGSVWLLANTPVVVACAGLARSNGEACRAEHLHRIFGR